MSGRSEASPFETITCSAPAARAERMRDIVLAHAPRDRPLRLLDVGCGTGALAFLLADSLPMASVTGVDISRANIESANARARDDGARLRLSFVRADYLEYSPGPPFDVVVTDTVLHFIRGRPDVLWGKLARDLRPGGVLACCMALDCAHNRRLRMLRRLLRAVRSRLLDRFVAALASNLYGRDLDDRLIGERLEYMYIPPEQMLDSVVLKGITPSLGLRVVAEYPVRETSATQLKQRITVFRKDTSSHD